MKIGLTLTEMFELGYLRVIPVDWKTKFQGDTKAHSLKWESTYYRCIRCNFKTTKVSDLRKNKGCHMFACHDTERIK